MGACGLLRSIVIPNGFSREEPVRQKEPRLPRPGRALCDRVGKTRTRHERAIAHDREGHGFSRADQKLCGELAFALEETVVNSPQLRVPRPFDCAQGRLLRFPQGRVRYCLCYEIFGAIQTRHCRPHRAHPSQRTRRVGTQCQKRSRNAETVKTGKAGPPDHCPLRRELPMNIAYILFAIGAGLVIVGSFVFYTILGEVNGRLPIDEQISMVGVNTKVFAVLRRHAQLFPNSRKRSHMLWVMGAGLTLGGMTFLALWR
jgi:hypothetical protein